MATITVYDGSGNRTLTGVGTSRSPLIVKQKQKDRSVRGKNGKLSVVPGAIVEVTSGERAYSSFNEMTSGDYTPNGIKAEVTHLIPLADSGIAESSLKLKFLVYSAATSTTKEILEAIDVEIRLRRPKKGKIASRADVVKALTCAIDFFTSGNPTLDTADAGRIHDFYLQADPD